jgi:hypothetical protein
MLELTIATAILSLVSLLAARALLQSQEEAQRYLSDLGRPGETLALALLRHDVRSARAVGSQPGWSESPLRLELGDGTVVTYRTDRRLLERVVSGRDASVTATTLFRGFDQWRWRTPNGAVVEVVWLRGRGTAWRPGRPARDRHEVSSLRLALRNRPRSGW